MFDFVLHLHCIILFILQFSMFCIFFWCSKSFLSALFRLNPEQHDQHPSLVQMIPKLDGTSTCLECQDMPQVTEAKIHLLNHVFFCEKCWEKLLFYFTNLYLYLLDSPPCLLEFLSRPTPPPSLNWKPSSDKITGGTEAFPPTWLASAEEITSLGHVSRKLDIITFLVNICFFPKLDFVDITLKEKWYDKWVVNYIKCWF